MTRYIAFCKIVELGSFTRAAEALGYTQAAVSQMIRSLEAEYKLSLITRMRTGIKLTPAGEELYPMIKKIVSTDRLIHEKIDELTAVESGDIRIGTFSSISQNLLPPLIRKFTKEYPGVKFTLRQSDISGIEDMIKQGMIDFGFCYPRAIRGLSVISLCEDDFLAVVPEIHPLAGRSSLSLDDLVQHPIIALDEGTSNTAEEAFEKAGLKPNLKYLVYDDYTILAMIEEGLGIGILPAAILKHTNYHFNAIKISPPITRKIGIAYQKEELLPSASRRFIEFLREHLYECTDGNFKPILDEASAGE